MAGLLVLFLLFEGYQFNPYYKFGDKLVYQDEGQGLATVSGYQSLKRVSSLECAESCLSMQQNQCDCCDSFTYNVNTRECYMKKRSPGASINLKFSNEGFQTFMFKNEVGSKFVEDIQPIQSHLQGSSSVFIHKGFGQLATAEGQTVFNFDGKEFLTRVSPSDCAQACNRVSGCSSFSYNPNKFGGTCYLKDNSDSSQATKFSSQGWTSYWKNFSYEKCFCPCNENIYCVVCQFDSLCFER